MSLKLTRIGKAVRQHSQRARVSADLAERIQPLEIWALAWFYVEVHCLQFDVFRVRHGASRGTLAELFLYFVAVVGDLKTCSFSIVVMCGSKLLPTSRF